MRVQINLGIGKRSRQLFNAIGSTLLGQLIRKKFRVVVCKTNDCLPRFQPQHDSVATIHGNGDRAQPSALTAYFLTKVCKPLVL
jgi:hypothetical protein